MHLFVSLIGVFALLVGLLGLIRPTALVAMVQYSGGSKRFWFAVGLRLLIGVGLLIVAPGCRFPSVVQILGGITILAALIILAAGQTRLDATIAWWISDTTKVRASALFAIVMGVLFIYVAD